MVQRRHELTALAVTGLAPALLVRAQTPGGTGRVVAVCVDQRSRFVPDVPTASDRAQAGFEVRAGNVATLGRMLRADIPQWAGSTRQIGFSTET
jgi:tripartite-type tricarboxylate transporter receptor subunit TctC